MKAYEDEMQQTADSEKPRANLYNVIKRHRENRVSQPFSIIKITFFLKRRIVIDCLLRVLVVDVFKVGFNHTILVAKIIET